MNAFWHLEKHKDSIAAVEASGKTITYAELANKADGIAQKWTKPRSLVFLFSENSIEFLATYLAALRNGHVLMLLSPEMPENQRAFLEKTFEPEWIVDSQGKQVKGKGSELVPDSDAALLLSTSGTTGTPKQVCLSYENLRSNAQSIAQYLEIDQGERPITTLPPHYSYGLSVINSHLQVGACLVLTNDALVTKEFWELFRRERCTSLAGVPTSYEMLRRLKIESMELPSLRTLTQAGGRLAIKHVKHFAELAKFKRWKFMVMYGQTEASPRMSYLPVDQTLVFPDSIGVPIPGGEFSLIDEDGHPIDENEVNGELVYRGRNVMLGYVDSREGLQKLVPLDALYTGDIAYKNSQGLYFITGRMKRFIKLHGHRISLDELERIIEKKLSISARCTGIDSKLVVGYLAGADVGLIKQAVMDVPGVVHTDFKLHEFDSWPVTASGKINYEAILKAVLDG